MLESLFNKASGSYVFQVFSCEFCENFKVSLKNTFGGCFSQFDKVTAQYRTTADFLLPAILSKRDSNIGVLL